MNVAQWHFEVFPYIAVIACVIGAILRYRFRVFSVSSLSSQFLESRQLFWGSVPWHYGIMFVFFAHFIAFIFPSAIETFVSSPSRLYGLETFALAFGVLAVVGLCLLMIRRIWDKRIRAVTTVMDLFLLVILIGQCAAGIAIAVNYRWGLTWFASDLSTYLWSLVKFQPNSSYVLALPPLVQFHIIGAFVILGLLPYSRLIHALSVPLAYLWRAPQVVIWNRRR